MGMHPSPKRGRTPQLFGPCLLWPNGCTEQDGTWHGRRPHPRRLCVRWGRSPVSPERGRSPLPNFRPISIVDKRMHASRCHLVSWYGGRPQRLFFNWLPSPPHKIFRTCVLWPWSSISATAELFNCMLYYHFTFPGVCF